MMPHSELASMHVNERAVVLIVLVQRNAWLCALDRAQ